MLIIIAAALAVPTRLFVHYTDDIYLQIRYLFLKINIPINEEQKAAQQKKKSEKPRRFGKKKPDEQSQNKGPAERNTLLKSRAKAADGTRKRGKPPGTQKRKKPKKPKKTNPILKWLKGFWKKGRLEAIITAFKRIAELVSGLLKPIFQSLRIRTLNIDIAAASDNAADTAVNYGKLCAGIYPALAVILNVVKYDDYNINIRPDFNKTEMEADIAAEVSLIPWAAVIGAVKALVGFVKYKLRGEL